ncbi:MAG TPA: hypothetical protein VLL82_13815 [Mycobacterium sp.]|nr:hypothetical protein [Mycobacterium sp.]
MTNPDTLMWEVRAAPGRRDELVAWVHDIVMPEILALPGPLTVDIYAGEDHVVVIVLSTVQPTLPAPPPELTARPPEQWPFCRVGGHKRGT